MGIKEYNERKDRFVTILIILLQLQPCVAISSFREAAEKEILDHLLQRSHYDKREKPQASEGILIVNASVIILSIEGSKDATLTNGRDVEYLLSLSWKDLRLMHATFEDSKPTSSSLSSPSYNKKDPLARLHLNGIYHSKEIWAPGIRLDEGDSSIALRIYGNGTVHWLIRRKKGLNCRGQASLYPFDEPVCSSTIETSTREDDLSLVWSLESPMILSSNALLPSSILRKMLTTECSERMRWNGNDSCLEMKFAMGRDLNYFWSNLFVPDMILVSSSFLTFWLDWRRCLNARIVLLVTVTLNYFIARMPATSSSLSKLEDGDRPTPAIYLWQAISVLFIYGSVVEFVLAGYIGSKRSDSYRAHSYFSHLPNHHYHCRKRRYGGNTAIGSGVLTIDPEHLEEADQSSINSCNIDQISQCAGPEEPFQRIHSHNHHSHSHHQQGTSTTSFHHVQTSASQNLPIINSSSSGSKFNYIQARKLDRISRMIFPTLYALLISIYFFKYLYN
nr:glutamate-gated chloride channel-like isoform X2 [Lepeophtheirus salmonis]